MSVIEAWYLQECHDAAVRAEAEAFACELGAVDVQAGALDERPDGEADLEVCHQDDVLPIRAPPGALNPRRPLINLAGPLMVSDAPDLRHGQQP